MKLSDLSLNTLKGFITGDDTPSPRMTGPEMVNFFNMFGSDDEYSMDNGGLPNAVTRKVYAHETLPQYHSKS